jgi:hypothetical protein
VRPPATARIRVRTRHAAGATVVCKSRTTAAGARTRLGPHAGGCPNPHFCLIQHPYYVQKSWRKKKNGATISELPGDSSPVVPPTSVVPLPRIRPSFCRLIRPYGRRYADPVLPVAWFKWGWVTRSRSDTRRHLLHGAHTGISVRPSGRSTNRFPEGTALSSSCAPHRLDRGVTELPLALSDRP